MMQKNEKRNKQPFFHVVRREALPISKSVSIRAAAVVLALIIDALFIYFITRLDPVSVYVAMFEGTFGGATTAAAVRRIWATVRDTMMLLCIAVALGPAFKMRFWNIGAEGQVLIGGVAAAACMIGLGGKLPNTALIVVMLITSMAAGAVWGVIPALFKSKWNSNETLFTLMMNYIAIQITAYCVALWEKPFGSNSVGIINQKTKYGWFPAIFGQQYLLNVILVIAVAVGMYFYMKKSKQGYEISVVGESERTARYAGINVKKVFIRTMLISGAIAGIAGFIGVAGVDHTISTNTAGGRGFTAIIVAWLSKFNTFVMIGIAFLLTFLDKGASEIASQFDLNEYASDIICGIILFFILGSEFFINYRIVITRAEKEEN